jgi:hypothetical protein
MGWFKKQIQHDSIIDAYYFEISLSALEQTLGYICYWRGWPRSLSYISVKMVHGRREGRIQARSPYIREKRREHVSSADTARARRRASNILSPMAPLRLLLLLLLNL